MNYTTQCARRTQALGQRLSVLLAPGDIVCLSGELGAGKTVFAKGIACGLGIEPESVSSPSFVLMQAYTSGRIPLYHFDFYRLKEEAQIADIGYEEFMYSDGVAVIEWPERLECLLPREYLEVRLTVLGEASRGVCVRAHGRRYAQLLERLKDSS